MCKLANVWCTCTTGEALSCASASRMETLVARCWLEPRDPTYLGGRVETLGALRVNRQVFDVTSQGFNITSVECLKYLLHLCRQQSANECPVLLATSLAVFRKSTLCWARSAMYLGGIVVEMVMS